MEKISKLKYLKLLVHNLELQIRYNGWLLVQGKFSQSCVIDVYILWYIRGYIQSERVSLFSIFQSLNTCAFVLLYIFRFFVFSKWNWISNRFRYIWMREAEGWVGTPTHNHTNTIDYYFVAIFVTLTLICPAEVIKEVQSNSIYYSWFDLPSRSE